ncbi:MAG TPA: hypothetical protein VJG65_01780 [Patescibacteria group bacterium]|nr:hypothetical protein [Patescibacteria group bacterium]
MENQDLINKLKDEVLKDLNLNQKSKTKFNFGNFGLTLLLALLAVVALSQTVASAAILNKIQNSSVTSALVGQGAASSNLPSNVQNLPNMVGGC